MNFSAYLKNGVWDYLLCAVASSALCYSLLIGFLATIPHQEAPWAVAGCCALLSAALFVVAFNFRTAVVGAPVFAAIVVGCAIASWAPSEAAGLFDDVVGNGALFVFMAALSAVAVFTLSRKRSLTLVLLVGGLILMAAFEYLYWDGQVVGMALFGISAACLFAYRNYQQKLIGSDSDEISFGSTVAAAGAIGLAALLLAAGVFALLIAPQEPPGLTVKLLTKHVRLDEEHVVGTGDETSIINDRLFSWNVSGTTPDSSTNEEQDPDSGDDEENDDGGQLEQDTAGSAFNIDGMGLGLGSAVRIRPPAWIPFALPLIILLVIAGLIAVRKAIRRRRRNGIRALPAGERVERFYLMFMDAFAKMKMAVPQCQTLQEYVTGAAGEIRRFEQVTGDFAFAGLTDTYSRVVYGGEQPSNRDLACFDEYYRTFHRRARKFVGPMRYIRLFFRI